MARQKKKTKKEPNSLATESGSCDSPSNSSVDDSITKKTDNQEGLEFTQAFKENDEYQPVYGNREQSGRNWLFIVYPESAPCDWIERLEQTGIPFAVSDLHEHDKNPDGSHKKPHYHVIVSYDNKQWYSAVVGLREITKGPYPMKCESVSGAYAYFTHKNNPEKYQYDGKTIKKLNGWEKALEASEVGKIKHELTMLVLNLDIREYAELILYCSFELGTEYEKVASENTVFFNQFITSYRNNPVRVLSRIYPYCDDSTQCELKKRIEEYHEQDA